MKTRFSLILVPALLAATGALAQGPGSSAYVDERSAFLTVDANYRAPVDCWRASLSRGAPAGAAFGNDIPVTVVMSEAGPCNPVPKVARAVGTIGAFPPLGAVVRIFFIDPRGRIVKTERVAVVNR
ncbi:MAG: hypothetical protein AB7O39_04185 [Flavobacteriaceae bacterium]